ncbi:MAG TPA: hypothetical protein PKE32_04555, partial [Miltoncostaeaceae bacterium]|nr:hypothetical protein [Miltoncostaeaceae bacterium]
MGDAPMDPRRAVTATVLGFPRIGRDRELKFALEAHWRGDLDRAGLERAAQEARNHMLGPAATLLDSLPSGDQALYDQMLDMLLALGLIPSRFADIDPADPALEFILARGDERHAPLEMTKWFDTNYHHLVPELDDTITPRPNPARQLARLAEARALGRPARPVLIGPYTFLKLSRAVATVDPLTHCDALVPAYRELIERLAQAGAAGIQIDEPGPAPQPTGDETAHAPRALSALAAGSRTPLMVATYFAGVERELPWLAELRIARLHLDLVRAPEQLPAAIAAVKSGACQGLSLGLVDGRNIWRTGLDTAHQLAATAVASLGAGNVTIATSCSLLHSPYSAARETELDPELREWLAFADEKLAEVRLLADSLNDPTRVARSFEDARAARTARRISSLVHNRVVAERTRAALHASPPERAPFAERYAAQMAALRLPDLPTTTIGSFPQTDDLRDARRRHRAGELDDGAYRELIAATIRDDIARQEALGLDVL